MRITIIILMLLWQVVAVRAGPLEDCEQAQDVERRIHGCTERIRQFPRDATAFLNRGHAYLEKGDVDRAIADNSTVIQIDPLHASAYYHRGIAHVGRAEYDRAIADFGKAVETDPKHGVALAARARVYLMTGRHTLALRDAERAVLLDPSDEVLLTTRARVYEAMGRTGEAVADYRRVLSANASVKAAIEGLRRLGATPPALDPPADAAANAKGGPKSDHRATRSFHAREEVECERAQHADRVGQHATYPCWAREAFSNNRIRGR
jgi:tetratricopeptide (TPR) repeat protein